MRIELLRSVAIIGLLFAAPTAQQVAVAQTREPTVDERYRDKDSKATETELPRLNAPRSTLTPPKTAANKNSAAAYLGVTFAGNERAAIVETVAAGSPAEQAGLQPNDLIETLQGRRIVTNQQVIDIVGKMRPGDVLDIGFTRRMTIRTQAPLASAPTTTTHRVGYPPASTMAAPEDPLDAARTRQNRNEFSTQRRNDNQNNSQPSENRRIFGRGLRLR